jgi:hypothetical protein
MLYLPRRPLNAEAQKALDQYQDEVDAKTPAKMGDHWDARLERIKRLGVEAALKAMAGPRWRCMYCGNGRGHQIEHYLPKATHQAYAYRWPNHLWICGDCNLKKGQELALDAANEPLLLNPTIDEPLKHMVFVPRTGEWTARVDSVTGLADPRGAETCDPRRLQLNIEAVTEGRRRAWRRLKKDVQAFLDHPTPAKEVALAEDFAETERPDVAAWALSEDTLNEPPFDQLHQDHPAVVLSLRWVIQGAPR